MGGFEQRKEECRDTLGLRVLDEVQQDTGYALRRLVKHPGFTAIAVSMVALGIGANTAIFSVLRASSLRSSPFPDPDRLAIIWTTPSGHPESLEAARLSEFIMWREQTQAFDSIGEMNGWSSTLGSMQNGEPADRLNGWRFSASTFQALRVQPQLGRLLTDEDCRTQGRPNVVIVSDRFWRVRFGGDPAVLGRTLLLDGASTGPRASRRREARRAAGRTRIGDRPDRAVTRSSPRSAGTAAAGAPSSPARRHRPA